MSWLVSTLRARPEIAFFLILGVGYLLGKLSLRGFKLGAVTGTLLAGVLVGQLGVRLSDEVQQCFFLLFLFAIGFRTGPQFFSGMKRDGLQHAALAAVVALTGLIAAWAVSLLMRYDVGTAAGLLSGALTQSASIGTALDAIAHLDLPPLERTQLSNHIPVAFAVTYLVGAVLGAWLLAALAPRLLGIDLADECRKLEEQMGGAKNVFSARREFELRAYRIDPGSRYAGKPVTDLEAAGHGARIFVEQLRRGGEIVPRQDLHALQADDVVAISGPRTTLVETLTSSDNGLREVEDRSLLDVPADIVDVIVTSKSLVGKTLAQLAHDELARGIFLRRISRGGSTVPILPDTHLNRGDVLTIVGSAASTARAAASIGVQDRASDVTDMLLVSMGIVIGAFVGLPALNLRGIEIGLSLPIGVLVGGLACGWLRAMEPRWLGRVPSPTLWLFESLGLTGFVAIVGLNAGPEFIAGVRSGGIGLAGAAAVTIAIPMLVGVLVGHKIFRMHPGVLLGVCAGGCTATPALAAVQEAARSAVPSLGYGVAYAIGNVLIALWGTVIVKLIA